MMRVLILKHIGTACRSTTIPCHEACRKPPTRCNNSEVFPPAVSSLGCESLDAGVTIYYQQNFLVNLHGVDQARCWTDDLYDLYDLFPLDYLDLPGWAASLLVCMIYLGPIAGWEPCNLHHLGHASWVGSVLHRSCTAPQKGRLASRWSICSTWSVRRV